MQAERESHNIGLKFLGESNGGKDHATSGLRLRELLFPTQLALRCPMSATSPVGLFASPKDQAGWLQPLVSDGATCGARREHASWWLAGAAAYITQALKPSDTR